MALVSGHDKSWTSARKFRAGDELTKVDKLLSMAVLFAKGNYKLLADLSYVM